MFNHFPVSVYCGASLRQHWTAALPFSTPPSALEHRVGSAARDAAAVAWGPRAPERTTASANRPARRVDGAHGRARGVSGGGVRCAGPTGGKRSELEDSGVLATTG